MARLPGTVTGRNGPGTVARIVLDGITLRKGTRTVLADRKDRFESGSLVWVTGPNGSGKSSLLRCLAGLEAPYAGRVRREPRAGRRVFYDPDLRLPPSTTVGAWLRLGRRLPDGGRAESIRAPWVAPGRRIAELSTGEEKRLILESILSVSARFFLLDEPFGHLSRDGREALLALLRDRCRDAVVVVATNRAPSPVADDRLLRMEVPLHPGGFPEASA